MITKNPNSGAIGTCSVVYQLPKSEVNLVCILFHLKQPSLCWLHELLQCTSATLS